MATNKNLRPRHFGLFLIAIASIWLAGCGPPGPRALLEGKRLMDQGNYTAAIEELKRAAALLSKDARAWNYLGLAYHHAGQAENAADAYQRALKLDHDLVEAHYNLGCLLLEQNRLEPARNELTAFTLHRGNSFDGWLKLGTAQLRLARTEAGELRLRDLGAAEKSLSGEALHLNPQNPEALNDLGLVEIERGRYREAAAHFNNALKQQPNYGPAMLNLAIVSQLYLNNRPFALQKYQEYLAANTQAANWNAVKATARQLAEELNPPPRPVTNAPAPAINPARLAAANPPRTSVATNVLQTEVSTKPAATTIVKPMTEPEIKPDVVKLTEPPPVKTADSETTSPPTPPTTPAVASDYSPPASADRKGFLQKINPANLFHHEPKPVATPTPLTPPSSNPDNTQLATVSMNSGSMSKSSASQAAPLPKARYSYVSPPKPTPGDRKEGERLFAQGWQAQHDHRLKDAVALYRAATQADPSFFEAQLNLGFAAFDLPDTTQALLAYETALAIKPDSFIARFNFALALQKAGYIQDAAQELERLVAASAPDESQEHLALAHLTLANLYAEQFHQPAFARAHYLKVLELDPHNPQATVIRYWLSENH